MGQFFKIPWASWYEPKDLTLELPDSWEVEILELRDTVAISNEKEIENGWRLACEAKTKLSEISKLYDNKAPHLRIFLPNQFLLEDFKILTTGISKDIQFQPSIKKIYCEVKKPSLEEPDADFERIESIITSKIKSLKRDEKIDIDFNILNNNGKLAGQLVNHVHFHIIPRNTGDGVFNRWPSFRYAEGKIEALSKSIRENL